MHDAAIMDEISRIREFLVDIIKDIPVPRDQRAAPELNFFFNEPVGKKRKRSRSGSGAHGHDTGPGADPGLKIANRKRSGKGGKNKKGNKQRDNAGKTNDPTHAMGGAGKKHKLSDQQPRSLPEKLANGEGSSKAAPTDVKTGMMFSRFDFADKSSSKKKPRYAGKDYKALLQKVEGRKEKMQRLAERDETKAKAFEEKMQWEEVLDKSKGDKVKTDEALLKRSLKRKQKAKESREKKWQKRKEYTGQLIQKKQDKRRDNLAKVSQKKHDKKVKRSIKKGRVVI